MKRNNATHRHPLTALLWVVLCAVCVPCALSWARPWPSQPAHRAAFAPDTTAEGGDEDYMEWLPGTHPVGTTGEDSSAFAPRDYVPIKVTARTYGDSIVLRWAVEDFPEWNWLNHTGYDILRITEGDERRTASGEVEIPIDTLAAGLRPMAYDDFRRCYPDTIDSLAYMAMGAIYGRGSMLPEQTSYEPGSIGAFVDMAQDQKTRLMAAYLAAEWRPDLAQAMGLRFTDRTVLRGKTYHYYIVPHVADTTGHFLIANGIVEGLRNERYKPAPYNVEMTDSVVGHGEVVLSWTDSINGTFDLFWRKLGETAWRQLTDRPYAPPVFSASGGDPVVYEHSPGTTGTYEYAVRAHDAFGDLTPMSAPHRVVFPDLRPPLGPEITRIVIDRPGKTRYDEVYANIHFRKDTMEEDFVRYVPLYYNQRDSARQWRLLSDQYVSPADTVLRVDVTRLSTGMVCIAAVDTAGNMGYSYPKLLRIRDARPPSAPSNLRALPAIDGSIALLWDMDDSLAVHYYDVFYANARDHEFTQANPRHVLGRSFTDTVATDLNERYIYYYVRAVDYAMNPGQSSDTLAVLRPNAAPPSRPHLDSAWTDTRMIHTHWIGGGDEIISHYNVYHRPAGGTWELLRVCGGDSVRALGHAFTIDDEPRGALGQRHEYAVETVSLWGISSGLSPVYSARVRFDRVVGLTPRLFATFDAPSGTVRLAWEADGYAPDGAPYYYCVYRRMGSQEPFRFITDVPEGSHAYEGDLLQPGEQAEYYLTVRFRDGRRGNESNRVTVAAPSHRPSPTAQ